MVWFHSSRVTSVTGGESESRPALFTTRSTLPQVSTACWNTAATAASSVTSALTPTTLAPVSAMLATTFFSRSSSMSTSSTLAWLAAKIRPTASPMPDAPPVTMATLPARAVPGVAM